MTRPDAERLARAHVTAEVVDTFATRARDTWAVLVEVPDNCGRPFRFAVVVERGVVVQSDGGAWSYWNERDRCRGRATWAERVA